MQNISRCWRFVLLIRMYSYMLLTTKSKCVQLPIGLRVEWHKRWLTRCKSVRKYSAIDVSSETLQHISVPLFSDMQRNIMCCISTMMMRKYFNAASILKQMHLLTNTLERWNCMNWHVMWHFRWKTYRSRKIKEMYSEIDGHSETFSGFPVPPIWTCDTMLNSEHL